MKCNECNLFRPFARRLKIDGGLCFDDWKNPEIVYNPSHRDCDSQVSEHGETEPKHSREGSEQNKRLGR